MEPAQAEAYRAECQELRREVLKRRARAKRTPSKILYLYHPRYGVLTGRTFQRKGVVWFKGDSSGCYPEPLSRFKRGGWLTQEKTAP